MINNGMTPELKKDLVSMKDYLAIDQVDWNFLIKIYGGGPTIVRANENIYSKPIRDSIDRMDSKKDQEMYFRSPKAA